MTREQAIEAFNFLNTENLVDIKFIDKIYDDFESMTCENCLMTHDYKGKLICDRSYSSNTNDYGVGYVYRDFACNEWESKDD